jgi:hypothetical protein
LIFGETAAARATQAAQPCVEWIAKGPIARH